MPRGRVPMQISEEFVVFFISLSLLIIDQCVPAQMEERQQAKHLYIKARDNDSLGPPEQADVRRTVRKLIQKSLNRLDCKSRFLFKEFPSIIEKTARCGKFVSVKTSEAFLLLEKYLILLLTFPWKTEFHTLKTYCGFLQCKIKSHLEDPEDIFKLIGFRDSSDNKSMLVLTGKCDINYISDVAFECVVASVECDTITEYQRCISEKGGTILDAVLFRIEGRNPDFSKKKLSEHVDTVGYSRPNLDVCRGLQQRGVGGGNTVTTIPKGLPFIDDDLNDTTGEVASAFHMGTVDDHMMASLQKLKTQPQRGHVRTSASSDDWSYVRTGLEHRYGKSYYDGVRGDVINRGTRADGRVPEERDDLSDEGIDIHEGPPPVLLGDISRGPPRSQLQVGDHLTFDIASKSYQTSGYRTGPYHTATYPPSNAVVCDEAPLSPGTSPSVTLTYDARSSVPQAVRPETRTIPAVVRDVKPERLVSKNRNIGHNNTNTLLNIERMKRGGQSSGAFRVEKVPNSGSNITEMKLLNGRWKCESCTMDNRCDSQVCEVCGKSRNAPLETDGPRVGESVRICSQCTLENKPGSLVCIACNRKLIANNINTYV